MPSPDTPPAASVPPAAASARCTARYCATPTKAYKRPAAQGRILACATRVPAVACHAGLAKPSVNGTPVLKDGAPGTSGSVPSRHAGRMTRSTKAATRLRWMSDIGTSNSREPSGRREPTEGRSFVRGRRGSRAIVETCRSSYGCLSFSVPVSNSANRSCTNASPPIWREFRTRPRRVPAPALRPGTEAGAHPHGDPAASDRAAGAAGHQRADRRAGLGEERLPRCRQQHQRRDSQDPTGPEGRSGTPTFHPNGPGLALLLLGLAAVAVILSQWRTLAPEGRIMVAVLPFANLTGDSRQEYFSDGLTEEMITQLGNRDPERLGVIARTSVMHYKNDREPLDRIVRELGVQYVLEGSVRPDANHVRITAQLIRASDQTRVWARQYDREPARLLTLQGEITQAIADEIQSSLGRPRIGARADSVQSEHAFAAYDLYLRGQYLFNKRTVPDLERAIRFFQQAAAADTGYARVYAALADAYVLLAGYSGRPPRDVYAHVRSAVLRALELDPALAEAHTAFALIVQNSELAWQAADQEFRRAIELNPNYATAHHWYAEHLMWRGRFAEALQESERARRLDPLSLIIAADNGAILYFSRQYDRAIEKWQSVQQLEPAFPRAHLSGGAYVQKGMFAEALADLESQRSQVAPTVYWAVITSIYGHAGRAADARATLHELRQSIRRRPVAAVFIAGAYAGVGDKDSTMTWLERAYAEHPSELTSLKVDPAWDLVRSEPRFQRLLERVG